MVVGWDFTAGHERARVEALRPLLAGRGLALQVIEPVTEGGLTVSSTKIREFLLEGNVEGAALLLGRPYDLDGAVVRGAGRGRGLGFATANLATTALLPARGVYAVRARLGGGRPGAAGRRRTPGSATSGSSRPSTAPGRSPPRSTSSTSTGATSTARPLRLSLVARLREERRFPSVEALRTQIALDAERARTLLGAPG